MTQQDRKAPTSMRNNILGPQFLARRDALDERIWAAADALKASTDADERAVLRAMIEGWEAEQGGLRAARAGEGGLPDPTSRDQLAVCIEYHAARATAHRAQLRAVTRAIAAVAVGVSSGDSETNEQDFSDLLARRAWLAEGVSLHDAIVTEASRLLALADVDA